jgi:hypothetical protein
MSGNSDKAAGMANEAAGKVKASAKPWVQKNFRAKALAKKQRVMPSSLRATPRTPLRTV